MFAEKPLELDSLLTTTSASRQFIPPGSMEIVGTRSQFLLLLLLIITVSSSVSQAKSIIPRPRPLPPSLKINTTQLQNVGASCSFTVVIRTSCSSVRRTRDLISLSFGDAYGNQVYVAKLNNPKSRAFERCSTDTFQIQGPCTYQICYLYFYRRGYDGWIPYDVAVYGYNTQRAAFLYNVMMPPDTWYGFNYCSRYLTQGSSLAIE